MAASNILSADAVDRQLEQEFADDIRDAIARLEVSLGAARSNGEGDATEALADVKRTVLNLVTQGRGLDLPLINLTLHQLFDYLSPLSGLGAQQAQDIQAHLDKLNDILDGRIADEQDAGAKLVRALPVKTGFDLDFGDITPQDVQVLVIVTERAMSHIIEREMAACGIRTTNVRDPYQAFRKWPIGLSRT